MTLEGAINLNETNDYVIYTMNSVTTGQYGVVVPKDINGTLNMLVDLHMRSSFDGVGSGTKTREQLVSEISEEYSKLRTKYTSGILVMPMIDEVLFKNTVDTGDKQKMFDEVKKIGAITSELYKKVTDQGIEKQKIDQKIIIVEKNQEDEKFVVWLKEQMPNFVDGILYSELSGTQEIVNPFVAGNDIFGTTPVTSATPSVSEPAASAPVSVNGIFDNTTPVAPSLTVEPVAPAAPSEPVVETPVNTAPSTNVDFFGTPASVQNTEAVSAPVSNTTVQNTVESVTPVTQTPVVEGPKPVESAALEGTIAFTPIPNQPSNPSDDTASTADGEASSKGSKGFVNLLILLVVLVGVTIISIELGKYLYSVYGA